MYNNGKRKRRHCVTNVYEYIYKNKKKRLKVKKKRKRKEKKPKQVRESQEKADKNHASETKDIFWRMTESLVTL